MTEQNTPAPADLVEAVAELQLAAFLAGRGSVRTKSDGRTFASLQGPTMDDYRRMAVERGIRNRDAAPATADLVEAVTGLKPITVKVFFPSSMAVSPDRAWWYLEHAIRGYHQQFATDTDPIRMMSKCAVVQIDATPQPDPRDAEIERLQSLIGRSVMASARLGVWLSAALDDPSVCEEMKADIREWFSAGEPELVQYARAALAKSEGQ